METLKNFDFNIELTGFSLEDIDFSFEEPKIKEDIPEMKKDSKSKRGEICQLGRHRLICGDSTDFSDIKKLVAGNKVDLLITDPPYNVDYTGKTKDDVAAFWLTHKVCKNDKKAKIRWKVYESDSKTCKRNWNKKSKRSKNSRKDVV